jgi:hypothetical protein
MMMALIRNECMPWREKSMHDSRAAILNGIAPCMYEQEHVQKPSEMTGGQGVVRCGEYAPPYLPLAPPKSTNVAPTQCLSARNHK